MRLIFFLLISLSVKSQYDINLIAKDKDGINGDTCYYKSGTDSVFRRVNGNYVYIVKQYSRQYHPISDIYNLQSVLDSKSGLSHTHTVANITNFPTTTASFSNSTDKNFVTDAKLTVLNNTSGTNTGDQTSVSGNAGTATALQNARLINGVSFNGSSDITVTASAGTLSGSTLAAGVTASSLTSTGKIATYGGVATVGNGLPGLYATVDATAQGANISTTTLYTVPANGLYRISIYTSVTRAATTSSTLPSTAITYTDAESSAVHTTTTTATNAGNSTTTTFAQTVHLVYAKAATAIQYSTAGYVTSGATTMQYNLHVKCEAL